MKEKNITNENLARMVQNGFTEMNKKFEKIDEKLERLDEKSISLEQGQLDIKLRLDNVAYRFELQELDKRITKLEQKQKSI